MTGHTAKESSAIKTRVFWQMSSFWRGKESSIADNLSYSSFIDILRPIIYGQPSRLKTLTTELIDMVIENKVSKPMEEKGSVINMQNHRPVVTLVASASASASAIPSSSLASTIACR